MTTSTDKFVDEVAKQVITKIDQMNGLRFSSAPSYMHPDLLQASDQLIEAAETLDTARDSYEVIQARQKLRHAIQNLKDTRAELS